ncbi:[protein-PII] uridylyltransferase [Moraxella sp. FZFQ2102]|uniref:[protein-PII] uridylyltransferase n=1 Tax=Moraxella sp. FZFQ2102 TaxID=2953752 RepID=UPI00209BF7E0|nr:[protein-PII] uridylyltransferase [Moraxella sp. FZFQ2102]USZ14193.1 [protein-PII] uridylyltransferase [Moraxella sp. FZFQ2102]
MSTSSAQLLATRCQALHLSIAPPPVISTRDFDGALVKHWLDAVNTAIDKQMIAYGVDAAEYIADLITIRTLAVDTILAKIFDVFDFTDDFALFAVGGYGRGELLPASDIDILLIGDDVAQAKSTVEAFVAKLWDIGVTPAISVRSLDDTKVAVSDQTIASALLEARLLAGNDTLADFPYQAVKTAWSAKAYFDAKMAESKERYLSHNATEYNLEPNIKTAPGGLRDLHMITWLGRFYFGREHDLHSLTATGFISPAEFTILQNAQKFLWCIRHHLHMQTARHEDRLLFDHQKTIAQRMGYYLQSSNTTHSDVTTALEAMMRLYYRHAMRVAAISEMLCSYFYENYLKPVVTITPIDDDFCIVREQMDSNGSCDIHDRMPTSVDKIAITHADVFTDNPANLLKVFLLMGQRGIKQITASTLRAIYLASPVIDDEYRGKPEHQALFLANLQESNYLFHRLRLMKRFGVLGNYLPAFGKIMGLMQYDLFHRYTVDAHTLLLVRILHRFGDEARADDFGLVSEVYQKIVRKDILVLAAIFHDIAKGRGGDHSKLGAVDAYEFCIGHGMSEADAKLVQWLVLEHLTMSLTAQKQDISDPEVIANFAEFTGSITRLNHLYVLTVADMNATNSQLWNTWRAALLKQLYISVHRVHSLGSHVTDKDVVIENRKNKACDILPTIEREQLDQLWANFGEEYFLKQKHFDIAWQSAEILKAQDKLANGEPIVALRAHSDLSLGGIQLLICAPDHDNLFATTVCVLDQLGLSVLDANILTATIADKTVALDSYVVIDRVANAHQTDILGNPKHADEIISRLKQGLRQGGCHVPPSTYGFNTKLKHFTVPTQVQFTAATALAHQGHHQMHLITKDRPSLLAKVGAVFSRLGLEVHGARITTLGERAEDMFYLSDKNGQRLDDDKLAVLKAAIIETLS